MFCNNCPLFSGTRICVRLIPLHMVCAIVEPHDCIPSCLVHRLCERLTWDAKTCNACHSMLIVSKNVPVPMVTHVSTNPFREVFTLLLFFVHLFFSLSCVFVCKFFCVSSCFPDRLRMGLPLHWLIVLQLNSKSMSISTTVATISGGYATSLQIRSHLFAKHVQKTSNNLNYDNYDSYIVGVHVHLCHVRSCFCRQNHIYFWSFPKSWGTPIASWFRIHNSQSKKTQKKTHDLDIPPSRLVGNIHFSLETLPSLMSSISTVQL